MKIGELLIELGFDAKTTKLNDFIRSVGDLNMSSIMAAAGLGGLYEWIKKILEESSNMAMGMNVFAQTTGLSAQRMKSWSNLAEEAGVHAGTLEETLKHMQMLQAKAKIGEADPNMLKAFALLNRYGHANIQIYEDVFTQQDKIRKGLEGMDDAQKRNVLSLLGINEQMLLFYKLSDDVYKKRDSQSVLNKEEVNTLSELWSITKKAGIEIAALMGHVGVGLAKWVTPVMKFVAGLIEAINHSKALQGVILSITTVIALLTGNIPALVASLAGLGTWALSNKDSIFKAFKPSESSKSNPLGLPEGVTMGLPPGVAYTGPQTKSVSITNHISGDNPHEIGQQVKKVMQEALNEAHYQTPLRQY